MSNAMVLVIFVSPLVMNPDFHEQPEFLDTLVLVSAWPLAASPYDPSADGGTSISPLAM